MKRANLRSSFGVSRPYVWSADRAISECAAGRDKEIADGLLAPCSDHSLTTRL